MEFYNQQNLPPKTATPSGSPWREKFTLKRNEETGEWEKVVTGKTNVQKQIDAAAESTRIYNIIEKFEKGEIGTLVQRPGIYGDANALPKDIFQAQQAAEQATSKLPSELRQTLINKGEITDEDVKAYVEKIQQSQKKEEVKVNE